MASQNSKFLLTLTAISSEMRKNNCRARSLQQLTTIVGAINCIWDDIENKDSQLRQKLVEEIQNVLKCVPLWEDKKQVQNQTQDRLELFVELIDIIKREQGKRIPFSMTLMLMGFANKILAPYFQSLKVKKIQQILTIIQTPSPANKKSHISYNLCLGFLQSLQDCGHPKIYEIVDNYSEGLLQNKSAIQTETSLKSMFSALHDGQQSNMALRVLSITLDNYVKQFEKQYDGVSRNQVGKFQIRVIGMLIKLIGSLTKSAQFMALDSQSGERLCNLCTNYGLPSAMYSLEINDNNYQIFLCPSCSKLSQTNANAKSFILFHLAHNNEPVQGPGYIQKRSELKQFCEILQINMNIQDIVYCEHNKQLKLAKQKIIDLTIFQAVMKKIWMKLWIMLMILSNHNDSATRLKAVKTIDDLHEYLQNLQQNSPILPNIKKCLLNRLLDTEPKIRLATINVLITILPIVVESFTAIIQAIQQQYLKPISITNTLWQHTAKQIMEVMDRLREVGRGQRMRQRWSEQLSQFVAWMRIITQLAITHEQVHQHQNKRKSKSKSKNKNKQQSQQGYNIIISKYKQIISQYIKQHKKHDSHIQELILCIINPHPHNRRISQYCYNVLIDVMVTCGIDVGVGACRKVVVDVCSSLVGNNWGYGQVKQLYWIHNSVVVGWMVEVTQGESIRDLVHQILNICEGGAQFQLNMVKCKILTTLLEVVDIQNHISSIARNDKKILEELREFITTELIPEANSWQKNRYETNESDDEYMEMLGSLLQCINRIVGDPGRYTLTIYENCWKYVRGCLDQLASSPKLEDGQTYDQNRVKQIKQKHIMVLQTIRMMLCMLPQIVKGYVKQHPQNTRLPFDTHFEDMFNSVKQIISSFTPSQEGIHKTQHTDIMIKAAELLAKLLELCHNFITQSQQLLICLLSLPVGPCEAKYINNTLLSAINSVVCRCQSVRELEGIRDIVMYFVHRLDCPQYFSLLECRWLYTVAGELYKKGFITIFDINKLFIYGITEDASGLTNTDTIKIKNICLTLLKQIGQDFFQSRQLFTNFSETIRFILHHKKQQNEVFLPLTIFDSSLPHPKVLSKTQQSQQALKPTILKCLCDHLNKLMLAGKFLNPTTEATQELFLILNSFKKCTTLSMNDFKTGIRCLMAIIDCIYFEVIQLVQNCKQGSDSCANILWEIMKVLSFLLNGVPFRNVNADVQKYFLIKNEILTLGQGIKIKKEGRGLEHLQYLHDLIICGIENGEKDDNQSDDSSTYDTSENKMTSNIFKQKQTKTKIKKQGKTKDRIQKDTKKPIVRRNKTAPKSSLRHEFERPQLVKVNEKEVDEYRKKLRNRQKRE